MGVEAGAGDRDGDLVDGLDARGLELVLEDAGAPVGGARLRGLVEDVVDAVVEPARRRGVLWAGPGGNVQL